MTPSGFIGKPPPVNGTWVETQAEAWAIYNSAPGEYGYPVQVGDRWLVPRTVRVLNAKLAAEAAAVHDAYAAMAAVEAEQAAEVRPETRRRTVGQVPRRKRAVPQQPQVRQSALF